MSHDYDERWEPGFDPGPDNTRYPDEHGECEDCGEEGPLYDCGHSILCEDCADDSAEYGALLNYEDKTVRRAEDGYRDAGGPADLGGW